MEKNKNKIDISNARSKEQREVMQRIDTENTDPFDWAELEKYHKKPILKKTRFWLVTENQWPYENSESHLLFIYKDNVSTLENLPGEAFVDLLDLVREFSEKYKMPGADLGMRFGNTQYSGASVSHLHAHLISPKENTQCNFWIGSRPKTN